MNKTSISERILMGFVLILAALVLWPARPSTQQPITVLLGRGDAITNGLEVQKSATLANFPLATTLTARNASGVQMVSGPAQWAVTSAPSSGTVASASIGAEASVRHVANCVSFSGNSSAAVAAAVGTFVIRDGAAGAGTVIWNYAVAHQVAAGAGIQTIATHSVCGLSITGTAGVAMTAEFNAGVTGEAQAANLSGINVS